MARRAEDFLDAESYLDDGGGAPARPSPASAEDFLNAESFLDATPTRPSWGEVLSRLPGRVRASIAETVAGMRAAEFAKLEQAPARSSEFAGMTPEEIAARRRGRTEQELATARTAAEDTAPLPGETLLQRGVSGAAMSAPATAAALAAGLLTRNPEIAAAALYPTTTGQKFAELANKYEDQAAAKEAFGGAAQTPEERTAAMERALLHGRVQGALEVGTEVIPLGKLLKPGTPALKRFINVLASEMKGETVATLTQSLDDMLADSPEGATVDEVLRGLAEGGKQLPETWIATAILAGAPSAIVSGAERLGRAGGDREPPPRPTEEGSQARPAAEMLADAAQRRTELEAQSLERELMPDEQQELDFLSGIADAQKRRAELEARDAPLSPDEQQELELLRRKPPAEQIAAAYGVRLKPELTAEDRASPIPDDVIQRGKELVDDALSGAPPSEPKLVRSGEPIGSAEEIGPITPPETPAAEPVAPLLPEGPLRPGGTREPEQPEEAQAPDFSAEGTPVEAEQAPAEPPTATVTPFNRNVVSQQWTKDEGGVYALSDAMDTQLGHVEVDREAGTYDAYAALSPDESQDTEHLGTFGALRDAQLAVQHRAEGATTTPSERTAAQPQESPAESAPAAQPPPTFPVSGYGEIPRALAEEAYSGYQRAYPQERQTLDQIAARGGFGVQEMDRFAPGWRERVAEPPTSPIEPLSEAAAAAERPAEPTHESPSASNAQEAAAEPPLRASVSGKQRGLEFQNAELPSKFSAEQTAALRRLAMEAGWTERGGKLIRNEEGEVTGRTKWLPRADWWPGRPGGFNEKQTADIIEKGLRGKILGKKQRAYFDFLLQIANESVAQADYMPTAEELRAAGLEEDADNRFDVGLVAQATEIDESAVERAAQQYEDDDAGFLRAVKAIVDQGRAAPQSRESRARPPQTDLLGEDVRQQQALADEQRRRDEARSPNREVSIETGNPADLFSQARRQRDFVSGSTTAAAGPREAARPSPKAASETIQDFGERLEGARKHAYQAYLERLETAGEADIAAEPLSKSWPEPDYQRLLDDGADPWVVAFIHAARDEIPTKPQKPWKLKGWVEQVRGLRDMAGKILGGEVTKDQLTAKLDEQRFAGLKRELGGRIDLYQAVGHTKSLKGVRLSAGHYSMLNGEKFSPPKVIWTVERAAKKTAFSNWPNQLAQGDTREAAIADFKRHYDEIDTQPKATKQVKFGIYSYRSGPKAGKWIIGKKVGKDRIDLREFDSVKEARAYLSENEDELVKAFERWKDIPAHRKESDEARIGVDHRDGADVTPEVFSETFGFRGVQFGNYVEGSRRQTDLNRAYDALLDLAGVLGVPPKALSLNGELGLAFGARGKGGKRAASAHYEPDTVVINLTKREGAGSLAHEWWHAVDNHFSRRRGGKLDYLTENASAEAEGVRPEVVAAFNNVVQAINRTSLRERSRGLDKRRTKPYWGTGREMAARAFESYIVAKLQDQSASNDYLANIVSEDYWKAAAALGVGEGTEAQPDYPYPTAAEIPTIRAAFDALFDTIETRETEQGVEMFQLAYHGSPHLFDEFKLQHIGSGEGAQAFGWGLYFAENKGVAESYQSNVRDVQKLRDAVDAQTRASNTVKQLESWIKRAEKRGETQEAEQLRSERPQAQAELEAATAKRAAIENAAGNLYEVDIDDAVIDRMLDWDAQLKNHPNPDAVIEAAKKAFGPVKAVEIKKGMGTEWTVEFSRADGKKATAWWIHGENAEQALQDWNDHLPATSGRNLYIELAGGFETNPEANPRAASEKLFELGFPGIKYLDEGSRGQGGKATRNLVVFDESAVTIKSVNGIPVGESYALTPAARDKADATIADLKRRLEQVGIADRVALKLEAAILNRKGEIMSGARGRYYARTIEIAMFTGRKRMTLDHEIIHALKDLGVIRNAEWDVLSKKALADDALMTMIRKKYARLNLSEAKLIEEAVAEMHAQWQAGTIRAQGFVKRAFERILDFLEALRNAFQGQGFQSAADIFARIGRGEMGRRPSYQRATGFRTEAAEPAAFALDSSKFNPKVAAELMGRRQASTDTQPDTRMRRLLDEAVFRFQDKFNYLYKAQRSAAGRRGLSEIPEAEDAYLAELRYHGMAGAAIEDFQRDHVEPLVKAIGDSGLSLEQVDRYLHARHAPEANAQLKRINPERADNEALSGMSDAQALRVIKEFREAGNLQALEGIAQRVDAITKAQRDLLRDSGLESADTIKKWEETYEHYVPLHREGFERAAPGKGKGFSVTGRQKRRAGSTRAVEHIVAHVVGQYETTVIRAEKNKVAKALLAFAENNPNTQLYEVDKVDHKPTFNTEGLVTYRPQRGFTFADNVVVVKVEGVDHTITFNERNHDAMRIASAIKNLGADHAGAVINVLTRMNRFLALVNTGANPEFIISNFARDLQTAGYNLSSTEADHLKWRIIKDVGKAWRGIRAFQKDKTHAWADHFAEFRKAGAQTGWMEHYRDVSHREKRLVAMVEDLRKTSSLVKVKRGLRAVEQFIEHENTAVENAIRLSAFVHARQSGISTAKAARIAKELTVNFNRKGDYGQVMNAMYLFYNASIQGSARIIVAATKSRKVRALLGATIVAAMFLDMLNRSLGGTDDDGKDRYDKIPDYVKERNLIIMLPGEGGDYLKIPLPWGYNVFHVMGQVMGEALTKRNFKASQGATRVAGAVFGAFNPIGSEATITQMVSPTITDPLVQWGENKDWTGQPLRPEGNPYDVPAPSSQQYWNSVREPSRWVAERLNELTGGNDVRPGLIDISPEAIDLVIDTFTGGAGRFGVDVLATPLKAIKGEEVESYEIPLVRKLYGAPGMGTLTQEYYEHADSVRTTELEYRHYAELRDAKQMREIRSGHADELALVNASHQIGNAISKLKQQRKAIEASTLPANMKKARIDQVNEQIKDLMERFNRMYNLRVRD